MSKHTPGPWKTKQGIGGWQIFQANNGSMPVRVHQEANARLIAAAPELLEALENILDALNMDFHELALAKLTARAIITMATEKPTPEQ